MASCLHVPVQMAWVRAVWTEIVDGKNEEFEQVLPGTWIDGDKVCWPRVAAEKCRKERRTPGNLWYRFPLVKVKHQSGEALLFVTSMNIILSNQQNHCLPVLYGSFSQERASNGRDNLKKEFFCIWQKSGESPSFQ